MMMARMNSSRILVETLETRRKVKELQEKAENMAWMSLSRRQPELNKTVSLLSEQPPAQ